MPNVPRKVSSASVLLWGCEVGVVVWDERKGVASFEYAPAFLRDGYEIAPILMPRRPGIYSFPELRRQTYLGLPGMLADSIPDKFGNALIDAWLARHGRAKEDFSPVKRLCYIGSRGMGALEFKPALRPLEHKSVPLEIGAMVELAQYVLDNRAEMIVSLKERRAAIETIIRVGTSAGGARAKALVSWNPATGEVRSGQVAPPPGFEQWILKFDGVADRSLGDATGYGRIEYAYHLMALDAGISMTPCRLLEENGRAHFMTKRFDRAASGEKVHLQSLCALAHYDFNQAGVYGYEQAFAVVERLGFGGEAKEQIYRRMIFNVVARNQDDHTKNIAFLLDREGTWRLAPAFDVIWAYNPSGPWTGSHQMTINGKRDGFSREDLLAPAKLFGIRGPQRILDEVTAVVDRWPTYAERVEIPEATMEQVRTTHRLRLADVSG